MKPIEPEAFDRKHAEAIVPAQVHNRSVIRSQMNRDDWLILGILALIWGGAFFFIGVAVRHVPPLTYVWLRLSIAALAMWAFLLFKGQRLGLPRKVWGSILLLALLNNAIPFVLFGWSQTHIASGLASILNATTPIWGVLVAHFLTHDERMSPRKIAGVLLGFGGVATMIGPALLTNLGSSALAQLACVAAALCYALAAVWARRFRVMGLSPISVTTGQLTAGALMMLPVALIVDQPWTHAFPPLSDRRPRFAVHGVRLRALFPADRFVRRDQRFARHSAGAAGRDPAWCLVPRRGPRRPGFPWSGPDRARPGRDRRRRAQPFPAGFASASSLAASGLVQSRSPT
jgi:drug/metabolite transporter (DMT)-like permease